MPFGRSVMHEVLRSLLQLTWTWLCNVTWRTSSCLGRASSWHATPFTARPLCVSWIFVIGPSYDGLGIRSSAGRNSLLSRLAIRSRGSSPASSRLTCVCIVVGRASMPLPVLFCSLTPISVLALLSCFAVKTLYRPSKVWSLLIVGGLCCSRPSNLAQQARPVLVMILFFWVSPQLGSSLLASWLSCLLRRPQSSLLCSRLLASQFMNDCSNSPAKQSVCVPFVLSRTPVGTEVPVLIILKRL